MEYGREQGGNSLVMLKSQVDALREELCSKGKEIEMRMGERQLSPGRGRGDDVLQKRVEEQAQQMVVLQQQMQRFMGGGQGQASAVPPQPQPQPQPQPAPQQFTSPSHPNTVPNAIMSRPIEDVLLICPAFRRNFDDCDATRRLEIRSAWGSTDSKWLAPLVHDCWKQDNFSPLGFPFTEAPLTSMLSSTQEIPTAYVQGVHQAVPQAIPVQGIPLQHPAVPVRGNLEETIASEIIQQQQQQQQRDVQLQKQRDVQLQQQHELQQQQQRDVQQQQQRDVQQQQQQLQHEMQQHQQQRDAQQMAQRPTRPDQQYVSPSRESSAGRGEVEQQAPQPLHQAPPSSTNEMTSMVRHLQEMNKQLTEAVREGQSAQSGSAAKIIELQGLLQESMKRNEEYSTALRNREDHIKEMEQIIKQKDAELRDKERHLTNQSVELMELKSGQQQQQQQQRQEESQPNPMQPTYTQHPLSTPTHGGIFRRQDAGVRDEGSLAHVSPVREQRASLSQYSQSSYAPGTPRSYGNRLQELVMKRKQEAAAASAGMSSRSGSR